MRMVYEPMLKEDRIQYLAVDIIKQAIFDLKSDEEKDRKTAKEFFKSEWFNDLCTIAEIEPDRVTGKLKKIEREREF